MAIDDIPDYPNVDEPPQTQPPKLPPLRFKSAASSSASSSMDWQALRSRVRQRVDEANQAVAQLQYQQQQQQQQYWQPKRRGIPKVLILLLFCGLMTFFLLCRQGWTVEESAVNSLIATAIVTFAFWYGGKLR